MSKKNIPHQPPDVHVTKMYTKWQISIYFASVVGQNREPILKFAPKYGPFGSFLILLT